MNGKQLRGPYFLKREYVNVYETLLKLSDNDDPNMREIAKLTDSAPPLKRRLLKAVNAASNGLTHRVDTAEQAVSLLGARRIYSLVQQILLDAKRAQPHVHFGEADADAALNEGR